MRKIIKGKKRQTAKPNRTQKDKKKERKITKQKIC